MSVKKNKILKNTNKSFKRWIIANYRSYSKRNKLKQWMLLPTRAIVRNHTSKSKGKLSKSFRQLNNMKIIDDERCSISWRFGFRLRARSSSFAFLPFGRFLAGPVGGSRAALRVVSGFPDRQYITTLIVSPLARLVVKVYAFHHSLTPTTLAFNQDGWRRGSAMRWF